MTRSFLNTVKKLFFVVSVFVCSVFIVCALTLPYPKNFVTDSAGVLRQDTAVSLEQRLKAFTASSTNEVAVVIVSRLEGETIEQASESLFKTWGIGKKGKDNGVLLLVAQEDRMVRIEVGYGLESVLTDARSHAIITQSILPAFKNGDYDGGVVSGVDAIIATINKGVDNYTSSTDEVKEISISLYAVVAVGVAFFLCSLFLFGVLRTLLHLPLFGVGFFVAYVQIPTTSFTLKVFLSLCAGVLAVFIIKNRGSFSSGGIGGGSFRGSGGGGISFGGGRSGGGGSSGRW